MEQNNKKEILPFGLKDIPEGVELFARYYLTNGNNAAEAGRGIGVDNGASFLQRKDVQKEIKRQMQFILKRLEVTSDRILEELAAIALFDIGQVLSDDGAVLPISEIPEVARRALAGLEVKELFARDGKRLELIGHLKKFHVESKLKALELLGKTLGLFQEKIEIEHKGSVAVTVDKFELESRIKQLVDAQLDDALQ